MNWLRREGTGHYLNEAGLSGAGALVGAVPPVLWTALLAAWRGRELFVTALTGPAAGRSVPVRTLPGPGPDAAEAVEPGSLDFVYLGDGPEVAAGLETWAGKVRPGGLLAGSGYAGAGKAAVDRFAGGLGVAAAFTAADPDVPDWFVRVPVGPALPPDRVTVVTAYDPGYAEVGEISRPNKEAYCRRHGYRFVCRTDGFDPARPPSWGKLRFVREELAHADWVFWTDADSLVADPAVPLTRFCWDSADLVLSADPYMGLNLGCWLARATPGAIALLDRLDGMAEFTHHPWWETAAALALYGGDPAVRGRVAVVPNKLFNAYPLPGGGYQPGDFVAHFPGMGRAERVAAMRRLAADVQAQVATSPARPSVAGGDRGRAQRDATPVWLHGSAEAVPTTPASSHDPAYFEFDRPELLALVPPDARDVLDVGCGAGRLGAALKARQPARVVGVEKDPRAAAAARTRLHLVIEGDAETLDWPFPPGSFDAVVCGDVLEHLRDPLAVLRRVRTLLRPDGVVVVSLPNARHHSVVGGLLGGDWTYEPAGLLDHTHLRVFTRREVEKLLHRAGFAVPDLVPVPGPGHAEWVGAGRPGEASLGGLWVGPLDPGEMEEFFTYQWLAAASPAANPDYGLTSIVILTHNQLAYTRRCVDSIRLRTDEPYELVVVDNGSADGTPEYLRRLAATDPRVRVVLNPDNRGFPAGANQGMTAAGGRQALLLNNDTVVTTGWLGRLLGALHSDPTVGLVGPCSNRVSGAQQVDVTYQDLSGLDGFAWELGRARAGVTEETDRLVGFCLLVRREVIDRVGLLDEGFGVGTFEDDDYCVRARLAGFRAVIARDVFVHHAGGVSFAGIGVDYGELMRRNEERFRSKWERLEGPPPEALRPIPPAQPPEAGMTDRADSGERHQQLQPADAE